MHGAPLRTAVLSSSSPCCCPHTKVPCLGLCAQSVAFQVLLLVICISPVVWQDKTRQCNGLSAPYCHQILTAVPEEQRETFEAARVAAASLLSRLAAHPLHGARVTLLLRWGKGEHQGS